jgi:hypothetical protein
LADFKNSSPLKLFGQMYQNLIGSIYGKSSVAIVYVVLIRLTNKKQDLPVAAIFVN